MNGTYSGTHAIHKEVTFLTLDVLRKAMDLLSPCLFEEFANKYGFSLDSGDYLVVPGDMRGKIPERKGIVFSRFAVDIHLLKGSAFPLYQPETGKKEKR